MSNDLRKLFERTAKIKPGTVVWHDRRGYVWCDETVDPRSSVDVVFNVKLEDRFFDLTALFYGSFEKDEHGKSQYGNGSLTLAASFRENLEFVNWVTLTENQVLELMAECYPEFHMPTFEIASGALTKLTSDINASVDPEIEVMRPFMRDRDLRKVVCAAHLIKHESFEGGELVIAGARHMQSTVRNVMRALGIQFGGPNEIPKSCITQGFIDQYEVFMDLEEAFKVATIAGQKIDMRRNQLSNKLTSEGLY